ncbi:hypothetical protein PsYK624_036350 [Phanerochaete sordida]|uniref:Uncharacterized protein n=1 Tax=Phanerochaete sordida TaxID=48140 RepID=A0A9P3LB76_9APHY|nr:hypothetical protein PsYK624_036350 [Phanerochaete sordida]
MELAVEDPPPRDDWQDLCTLLGNHFGQTLRTLKISPTSTARFNELMRSTSRAGDVELKHLPLVHLGRLPYLYRLEIELPESAIFYNDDLAHLAQVCPNLEIARLCGQAKFPPSFGPPPLTLEGIIPLTSGCTRLHTLAVVVHAADAADETFKVREHSSRALMRLNVGHSWAKDPLAAAILLSHIAPHLEILRWFAPVSRASVIERPVDPWQKVQDYLPQLQRMRLIERSLMPKPVVLEPPKKAHKEVDATPITVQRGVLVRPAYVDSEMQVDVPERVEMEVQALPDTSEVEVDATPAVAEEAVEAVPQYCEQAIEAIPVQEEKLAETAAEPEATAEEEGFSPTESSVSTHSSLAPMIPSFVPSVHGIVTLPFRAVRIYTYYLSLPLRYMFSFTTPLMPALSDYAATMQKEPQSPSSRSDSQNSMDPMSPSSPSHENANGNASMHSTVGH